MNESLLILSEDAVFARMLELEFRMHGISVRVAGKDAVHTAARVILVDLDSSMPPDDVGGRVIGFTKSFSILASDPERRCSMILHRPFSLELLNREVTALLSAEADGEAVKKSVGGELFELRERTLFFGKAFVTLSTAEAKVMAALIAARPSTVSRERLTSILGESSANKTEVYICFLRKKLEELTGRIMIRTVRGVGYRLE